MKSSFFKKFPNQKGPIKMLVYGEPGTFKTRRALQMPGPLYVIDLECGAGDYGDLVDPESSFYLRTKSHTEVADALDELLSLPYGSVGTLIIDPITQIWQSLQNGHVSRTCVRKNKIAEDVHFDVGTWGKLKRGYSDIMAGLLSAPFHVVMTARGKEKIDERGNLLGYGYEGEKSTMYLANVVIECQREGDVVIKDRTGTYPEVSSQLYSSQNLVSSKSRKQPPRVQYGKNLHRTRLDFRSFLPEEQRNIKNISEILPKQAEKNPNNQGIESDSLAAYKDAKRMEELAKEHPEWRSGGGKQNFLKQISAVGLSLDIVSSFCKSNNRPIPSRMPPQQRIKLLDYLLDSQQLDILENIKKGSPQIDSTSTTKNINTLEDRPKPDTKENIEHKSAS
jgi:hypothetical protein